MRHFRIGYLKTVWILGAGFSRSLGGPLMLELLRYRPRLDLDAHLLDGQSDMARRIHEALAVFRQGVTERQWTDPEMFLDAVERMAESPGGNAATRLSLLMNRLQMESRLSPGGPEFGPAGPSAPDPKQLAVAGKRALALDCCAFLRTADPTSERWRPYAAWARWIGKLTSSPAYSTRLHTILTFNYDRVLEKLPADGNLQVVMPSAQADDRKVAILKVHGSVDWKNTPEGTQVAREEEALLCSDDELALATPGPGKSDAAFGALWSLAETAIREAQVVVFLGYRFPQGDADARRRILSAVAANQQQCLVLMPVLGPDLASDDLRRTIELLRGVVEGPRRDGWFETTSTKTYKMWPRPLFAEDYLSLYGELGIGEMASEPRGA